MTDVQRSCWNPRITGHSVCSTDCWPPCKLLIQPKTWIGLTPPIFATQVFSGRSFETQNVSPDIKITLTRFYVCFGTAIPEWHINNRLFWYLAKVCWLVLTRNNLLRLRLWRTGFLNLFFLGGDVNAGIPTIYTA